MQTITVCTDAGHKNYNHQSVAVWATYIRTPSQTIHASGIISRPTKGSSHAELYAIANALYVLSRNYDLSKYKVILYADNLYALQNHRDGTLKRRKSDNRKVYNKWIRPHIDKAKEFEARHVKGHLPKSQWGTSPARFFMQDWCDQEVHRIMKIGMVIAKEKHNKTLVLSGEEEHN
jgi:hypothetical protein